MRIETLILLSILVVIGAVGLMTSSNTPISSVSDSSGMSVNGWVTVDVNGERVSSSHNVFTNIGRNITRDLLSLASTYPATTSNVSTITLGNETGTWNSFPNVSTQIHHNQVTECGLTYGKGTTGYTYTQAGNWTVANTFTASCGPRTVNTTGLFNGTSASFMFAGDNFTAVTLQINDQITITWYIWVS